MSFNPRSCARSDKIYFTKHSGIPSFNPRSCARSDTLRRYKQPRRLRVSIHAPVQGATGGTADITPPVDVSIHAPVQGATSKVVHGSLPAPFQSTLLCKERRSNSPPHYPQPSFNPRSCARSDVFGFDLIFIPLVSIHAPVQGATFMSQSVDEIAKVSIHAPVQGATRW